MVVPCYYMIQCCLAALALPSVVFSYMGVFPGVGKEGIQFIVRFPYVGEADNKFVQGLCVSPAASWMSAIEVTVHDDSGVSLSFYPDSRRVPYF